MNALVDKGLQILACGAAAVAITVITSASFVESTAVVRHQVHTPAAWTAKLAVQPVHSWFGQPEPAVLVD